MNLIPWRRKRASEQDAPEHRDHADAPLANLRDDVESIFERYVRDPWGFTGLSTLGSSLMNMPRTDLADADNEVTVTMEMPGIDPKNIDINIAGETLTVRGEKKAEKKEKKKAYHYVERQHGSFQRTVQLPSSVDSSKVDAGYKNGVLTISIAKRPEAKPKRITVRHA